MEPTEELQSSNHQKDGFTPSTLSELHVLNKIGKDGFLAQASCPLQMPLEVEARNDTTSITKILATQPKNASITERY